ncbi:hypothetical protein [Thiococcus pfennigii]|uniref:hypothetical protein n=1 Tax=Thiococcus pfennigii TaxID=1057 RepID=UPI001902EEF8|nr:hypothetical protein [Thiococcus pfennigii]MBK1700617.1 hypothetical protein [Thiococcus pfennigii]MBK1732567.1 hypothetical protein [Thiococcus pfennigii]
MPPSQCLSHRTSGPPPALDGGDRPPWWSQLTPEWRHQVVVPQRFRVFEEYEVAASRILGYDEAGDPCFCACDYRLTELRSDDDEEFYQAAVYAESLTTWRLLDGRWLVYRRVEPLGEEGEALGGFNVAERMPR